MQWLSSQETADLLGVQVSTVYAYASRGMLTSHRVPGGRGSRFDRDEVEALLRRGRSGGQRGVPAIWRGVVVDTDLTAIEGGRLFWRGVDAVDLVALGFEPAARWLWTGSPSGAGLLAPQAPLDVAAAAVRALPAGTELAGAIRVAVAAAACGDPLRFDLRGPAVLATAGGLVALMVQALPPRGSSEPAPSSAGRLWCRVTAARATPALLAVLDAALVLLMDHDLAVSTVAVRAAASARADPYAAVSTGLAAMEGPLHGAASASAYRVLRQAMDGDPTAVVAEHLRAARPVPGFGHRAYPGGDPRAVILLDLLAAESAARPVLDAVAGLARAAGEHPNVDLALAAWSLAAGAGPDAGEAVFCVSRTVGWIAHAMEEYEQEPLRFRGQGRYRGPRPPQPAPSDA